jgi:hypothetical protein
MMGNALVAIDTGLAIGIRAYQMPVCVAIPGAPLIATQEARPI